MFLLVVKFYFRILSVIVFVTEEILTEFSLAELKLKSTISEEEYKSFKADFEKDTSKG